MHPKHQGISASRLWGSTGRSVESGFNGFTFLGEGKCFVLVLVERDDLSIAAAGAADDCVVGGFIVVRHKSIVPKVSGEPTKKPPHAV